MPATRMFVASEPGRVSFTTLLAGVTGLAVFVCGAPAHAQCTMDTECKEARICENASCVDPAPAAPLVAQPSPPPLVRHSESMRAAGIASVVLAGFGAVVAARALLGEVGCGFGNSSSLGSRDCGEDNGYILGGLASAAVLAGVGIPLIVIGSRKEQAMPENAATVSPWVGRQSAGLSLRFEL